MKTTFKEWLSSRIKKLQTYVSNNEADEFEQLELKQLLSKEREELVLNETNLTDLIGIEEFKLLKVLIIKEGSLFTKVPYLSSLTHLQINHNYCDFTIEKFSKKLQGLDLYFNGELTKIPALPSSLKWIDIESCKKLKIIEYIPMELININHHRKTSLYNSGFFSADYTFDWEKYVVSFHLNKDDEFRGKAAAIDSGLFDFKTN